MHFPQTVSDWNTLAGGISCPSCVADSLQTRTVAIVHINDHDARAITHALAQCRLTEQATKNETTAYAVVSSL